MIEQTVNIKPGDKGADYVALAGAVTIARLKAEGISFVIRYIARRTTIGKIITPTEVAQLHAAGIAIVLNYEGNENDMAGGAVGGAANGTWSRDFAAGIGYPTTCPLVVSVDADVFAANRGSARAYVRAFMAAAAPFRPGVYGDSDVMAEVADLDPMNWRANAEGWGPVRPGQTIHVQQRRAVNGIDPNVCLAPFEAWLPHATPTPPKPTPPTPEPVPPATTEELDMIALDWNPGSPDWTAFCWSGTELAHTFNGHADAVLRRASVKRVTVNDDELLGIIQSSHTTTEPPHTLTPAMLAAWD